MEFKSDHKARDYLDKTTTREKAEKILLMSRQPIIIGGCGRSGTTLLLSILSCHPKIFCIGTEKMAFCPDGFVGAEYNKDPNLDVPLQTWKVFDYLIRRRLSLGFSEISRSNKGATKFGMAGACKANQHEIGRPLEKSRFCRKHSCISY